MSERKAFVLSIDGMDIQWLRRWLGFGELRNLSGLISQGSVRPLVPPAPPDSAVAWATLMTGLNPGWHGVFSSSRARADGSGNDEPFPPTLAQMLSDSGLRAAYLLLPHLYPPPRVQGIVLPGPGIPLLERDRDDGDPEKQGWARIFASEYDDRELRLEVSSGGYRVPLILEHIDSTRRFRVNLGGIRTVVEQDRPSPWLEPLLSGEKGTRSCLLRILVKQEAGKVRVFRSPIYTHPEATDSPLSYPPEYAALVHENIACYIPGDPCRADASAVVAGLLPDELLFDQAEAEIRLCRELTRRILQQGGYNLIFCHIPAFEKMLAVVSRRLLFSHPEFDHRKAGRYIDRMNCLLLNLDRLLGKLSASQQDLVLFISTHSMAEYRYEFNLRRWLEQEGFLSIRPGDEGRNGGDRDPDDVDWERTRAYPLGSSQINLNLKGREKCGTVEMGKEYREVRADLAERLAKATNPFDGTPMLRRVSEREKIYAGDAFHRAGDLVLGFFRGTRSVCDPEGETVRPMQKGPGVGSSETDAPLVPGLVLSNRAIEREEAGAEDLLPTLLSWFGLPVPENLEGKDLFSK